MPEGEVGLRVIGNVEIRGFLKERAGIMLA